ncbi:MAG: PQQ-binding-like beta-propeller repeat protein [Planctomycetaceae bacterium]
MKSSRRVSHLIVLAKLVAVVSGVSWLALSSTADAQIFRFPGVGTPAESEDKGLNLRRDRRVESKLGQLSAAASKKNTTDVLEHLESLRAADPMLVVLESSDVYVPLHRALTRQLQDLTPEIRKAIESADPGAEVALKRAIETESAVGLAIFLQRFAGTRAAEKAHLILAKIHADRGHNLAARYWLAPLLTANADPELKAAAEKFNAQLDPSRDTAMVEPKKDNEQNSAAEADSDTENPPAVDGPTEKLSAVSEEASNKTTDVVAEPAAKNQEDSQSEPNAVSVATENAASTAERYIQERHWYKSLPISATARTRSQQLLRESSQLKAIPWSAWKPELDDEFVYVRSPGLISAFHLSSGQHIWTRTLTQEQSSVRTAEPEFPGGRFILDRDTLGEAMNSPEILQLHRDERVGRMTSDPERLYLVSQLSTSYGPSLSRGMMRVRGVADQFSAGLWELIAIDKKTGRRLWTMGGTPVEEKFGNELALAWLAGPPTVDRGNLHQVIERDSVVELICLEASTGRVRWQVPLAYPENGIGLDPGRQLLSAQTTARAGLVYTTSTTGWLFAIDTLTRSTLWARKLLTNQSESDKDRMLRNAGMFVPNLAPLGKAWLSQPPILVGDYLLVPTAESERLMFVDVKSGKTRSTSVSAAGSTIVLHCDEERLVVASPESIVSYSLPKLKKLWTLKLTQAPTLPVGPGVLQGNNLYVPLADGSAAVVSMTDGTLKQTLKRFRPAWSSGGLYATKGGILSHAPDHLTLLSLEPAAGHDETDPLQHAIFLFESGEFKDASLAAAKIPVTALRRDILRRLRFRIAVAMLKADETNASNSTAAELIGKEAAQLEEIAGMAQTAQEKALTNFLRLDFLLRTAPGNVVPSLIDTLTLDDSVLTVDIPVTSNISELLKDASGSEPLSRNPLRPGKDQRFVTFRAWVLKQLRERLAMADEKERNSIILGLAAIPDATILEMHSKHLIQESLRRVEAHLQEGKCSEVVLQLLISAADAQLDRGSEPDQQKQQLSARIATNFEKARELLLSKVESNTVYHELLGRIVATSQYELQHEQPGIKLAPPEDITRTIVERLATTPELPFTTLPVSNSGRIMGRLSGKSEISPYSASDSVLSAFRWTARTVPSSIQAKSLRDPLHSVWGLSQSLPETPNENGGHELYRFGTIMLLADNEGLSAFSIAEQRWLWRKTVANGFAGRRAALREQAFSPIEGGIRLAMMSLNGLGLSICGGSSRWVCLKTDDTIEVVDLYSGNRLWGMPTENSYGAIFAFRSGILRNTGFQNSKMLNPIDGTEDVSVPSNIESLSTLEIMRETRDSVLALKRSRTTSLEWIAVKSGMTLRSIELPQKSFAFLSDSETLALLSDTGDLKVINLINGDQQDFIKTRENVGNALPADPAKLGFHTDMLNYYLYEADENGLGQFAFQTSRVIPVKTAVAAFSRSTGKLAWIRPLKGSGSLYLDGPEEAVVLAEASENVAANAGARRMLNIPGLGIQIGQVYILHGLSRSTGLSRFSYKVSAQRPFPEIRLTKTTANQLDLEAFGNRVRFISASVAASP